MKTFLFLLLLTFLISNSDCSGTTSIPFLGPKIIQSEAKFIEGTPRNVKVTESKINLPTKEVLTDIIFFDKNNFVFIGNKFDSENNRHRTFFKTEDGGKNWQDNEAPIPEGAGIYRLLFTNPKDGWMILANNPMEWDDEHQTWLMKTSDGGKSWKIVKTANKTTYREIEFVDEKNGWIIGSESFLNPTATSKPLIYKTSDGGDTWTETSTQFLKSTGIDPEKAYFSNLFVETPQTIKLTDNKDIFESKDGGETWHRYGPSFSFLRAQNGLGNLGKIGKSNRIKAAQGGLTVEGRYVYLATEEANGDWINREITAPINLSNAFFLTEKDVFIFGTYHESLLVKDWENRFGVIYYSADGGATFMKIYETKKSISFGEVKKIADNQFFVVGAEGLVVNIELNQL